MRHQTMAKNTNKLKRFIHRWICTFVLGRKWGNTVYYITKMQHEWFFRGITNLISLAFVGINM